MSKSDFLKLSVNLPPIVEQVKIADCLSLLDKQITAQSHKTNALRAFKKGLMQELFPAITEDNYA